MRKYLPLLFCIIFLSSCASMESAYQKDTDAVRVRDIDEIAHAIGKYFEISGTLPLQNQINDKPIEVFITHRAVPASILEQTKRFPLELRSIEDLESDFSSIFNEEVVFPDDPQKVMTFAPNFYTYHVEKDWACVSGNLYFPHENAELVYNSYYKYQHCLSVRETKTKI
jgi:hypothetical protein